MSQFIISALAAVALLAFAKVVYDTRRFKVEHLCLKSTEDKTQLRILFFSDLHYRFQFLSRQRILRALKDCPADLILFGGDLDHKKPREALRWLSGFHRDLKALWDRPDLPPIIGVRGNHDADTPLELLRADAFYFLENECSVLSIRGTEWTILGLGDLATRRSELVHFLRQEIRFEVPKHAIVLAHNPDTLLQGIPTCRLALFGHYHDGQIRLPFRLEFKLLRRKDRLAQMGIISGPHRFRGQDILISPGIGNTFLPFRFFSHAGVHLIEF